MENVDLVISMNYYRFCFLKYQLVNFNEYFVNMSYVVLLNVSADDFEEAKIYTKKLGNLCTFIINPVFTKRKRFHGSLTKCIVSNMQYIKDLQIDFKYFLVLSNRSILKDNCSLEDFKTEEKEMEQILSKKLYKVAGIPIRSKFRNHRNRIEPLCPNEINHDKLDQWHWPKFSQTKFFNRMRDLNSPCHATPHEGLFFEKNTLGDILNFCNKNIEIIDDLFNFDWAVEELFFGTLCHHLKKPFGILSVFKFKFRNSYKLL